jgi:hypothetical protein
VQVTAAVNRGELRRYLGRIVDRWPITRAYLGGARVADELGAWPQRERGPEFVIVLVSDTFHAVPWLERVYVDGNLWDGLEMGAAAEFHCYTPEEFERKQTSLAAVREAVGHGLNLLTDL